MDINHMGIIQKITRLLNQPFPYFQKKRQMVVLIGLCIFTIVQYFAFDSISFHVFVGFVGGFTITCSVTIIYIFPRLFKRFFDKKQWTRGKYFVFCFVLTLMIAINNTLYDYIISKKIYHRQTPFLICLYNNLITAFLIGIVPTAFGYFWIKKQKLYFNLQKKEDQCQQLISCIQTIGVSGEKTITLSGNSKDSLTLFPQELFYIESLGNYVQVYYKMNGKILHKTLRSTLQQMEEFLIDYSFLVRCHRAFIVNVY